MTEQTRRALTYWLILYGESWVEGHAIVKDPLLMRVFAGSRHPSINPYVKLSSTPPTRYKLRPHIVEELQDDTDAT